jgi:hypothetical protein
MTTKDRKLMPTKPEDDYTDDDCECPACKAGFPKSMVVPAELPDGRKVTLHLPQKAYEKLQQLIKQRSEA